jgi:teichoic acid transport system ATP-binding protein
MNDVITVNNLKIRYKSVGSFSIKRNLLHLKSVDTSVFEAVKGVSFNVKEGEILGIIGKNGSGKSTLLRAIANIFTADEGTIDLHGKTISLLSIGVGFNGNLTGRKNIELSGLLLGFPETMIKEKMDEIIEFSELGDFIDKPVRMYSSGMYSKLAFAITACLETDIMLIDEVLSVGDEKFKKKSYNKMKELITQDNKTVVIVSHSTQTLEELCDRVMWLHDGEIKKIGNPKEVLDEYKEFMK